MTDYGSQFMNKTLEGYAALSGVRHHASIPYSKEENNIVERANKEVNRHTEYLIGQRMRSELSLDTVHDRKAAQLASQTTIRSLTKRTPVRSCENPGAGNDGGNGPNTQ